MNHYLGKFILTTIDGDVRDKYFVSCQTSSLWIQAASFAAIFPANQVAKIECARIWSVVKEVKREDKEVGWDIVPSLLRF